MRLLVLAGGKGSRLKSEVPDLPKVLAPINNNPFLDFQMRNWLSQGVNSFIFVLHHDAEIIKKHIVSKYRELVTKKLIKFVVEPYPLDTGGAIANAVKELKISGKFLVTNADTWLGSGFQEVWESPSPAIGIIKVSDISRFGEVNYKDNKITSFEEKNNKSDEGFINAGIFLFKASHFSTWKHDIFSLERDFLPSLVAYSKLIAVKLNTDFIDIGIPSDYNRFCEWILSNKSNRL
ncbi:sugar phosphate nucleotidyltransferase [Gammaproteobacteria bacterium]|nr:sugar phosphate nucleotidyltransferase [Gammaproteobacteria bacterium]MDA9353024.1 sugar phosphate nucleotidyltransferase [Gammaproteobacteria bacterium]